MSPLRLALLELLLGAWLALSCCTVAGAVLSFRVASHDPASRAQAAAFNGRMFTGSVRAQVALGGAAALLAAWPRKRSRAVAACVLGAAVLAAGLALVVVPLTLESVPAALRDPPGSAAEARMRLMHHWYLALDGTKVLLVVAGAVLALRGTARRKE